MVPGSFFWKASLWGSSKRMHPSQTLLRDSLEDSFPSSSSCRALLNTTGALHTGVRSWAFGGAKGFPCAAAAIWVID
eukprot:2989117-Ditylum_brightwellii.AAC.1